MSRHLFLPKGLHGPAIELTSAVSLSLQTTLHRLTLTMSMPEKWMPHSKLHKDQLAYNL